MPTTTGYIDTFNRVVVSGMGAAETPQQSYSYLTPNTQYNVTSGTATIAPSTGSADRYAFVDHHAQDIDITGQVALSAIPATALATAGFVVNWSSTSNYISGTMMVAAGGALSLRFSKMVGGGLTTVATVSTGITYVAGTFYNLRVSVFWSQLLQVNVLQSKLWAIGATEPGGWMCTATEPGLTPFLAGTRSGIFARDEQATPSVTASFKTVAAKSFALPMPATNDTMCIAAPATTSTTCSLGLADGSFETTTGAWAATGATYARQQATVYDGSWSAQITAVGTPTQMYLRPASGFNPAVTVGSTYTVRVWVRSATAFTQVSAAIDWFDAGSNYLSTSTVAGTALTANTWTLFTATGVAPASAAFASYGPTVGSPTAGQSLFVDNVDLQGPCIAVAPVYPKQTALQSLAAAADTAMLSLDPLAASAALYPRVRVSATNQSANSALAFFYPVFTNTEFNVGTPTNLGYVNSGISLGVGVWLITFEVRLSEAASSSINVTLNGGPSAGQTEMHMRSNAVQSNDQGVGGTGHFTAMTWVTDPVTPSQYSLYFSFLSTTAVYNIAYMALSAVKISDYFA